MIEIKSSLKAASRAGVTGAQGAENLNVGQATLRNFRVLPEALKVSGQNIKGNYIYWTSGVLGKGANELRSGVYEGTTKPVETKFYRFDPNGTVEEVLAKNPNVSYDSATGQFYVKTSWGENAYIRPGEEYLIAEYKPGDYNAITGTRFQQDYANYNDLMAGTETHFNVSEMQYGEVVSAAKPGKPIHFKFAEPGTKIQTQEGVATLQEKSLIMIDAEGHPYQNTVETFLQRNTGFSDNAMRTLYELDAAAVESNNPAWLRINKPDAYSAMVARQEAARIAELSANLESKYGIKINNFESGEIEISQYGHTRPIIDVEFTCNGKNYTCTYGTDNNIEALDALTSAMENQGRGVYFSSKIPGASKINPAWDIIPGAPKPADLALVDKGINLINNTKAYKPNCTTIQFEYNDKAYLLTVSHQNRNINPYTIEGLQDVLNSMASGEMIEGAQIQTIHPTDLQGNYFTSDFNPFLPSRFGNK